MGLENKKLKGDRKAKQAIPKRRSRSRKIKRLKNSRKMGKLWKGKSIKLRKKRLKLQVDGKGNMLTILGNTKEKVGK